MKRLAFAAFMVFVSLMSYAQDVANDASEIYIMNVYFSDSTTTSYYVTDVDSIVYNVAYLYNNGSVDLGLSVKWAACNIGASSPEECGNYYAWGEIETKDDYSSSTSITYSLDMDDISGNATYDAATANWGGTWRMPTDDEIQELIECCTWTWTTQNNVTGYLVTGSNGNSIFLPLTGYYKDTSFITSLSGRYWSSTPTYPGASYGLHFNIASPTVSTRSRNFGCAVRPVTD